MPKTDGRRLLAAAWLALGLALGLVPACATLSPSPASPNGQGESSVNDPPPGMNGQTRPTISATKLAKNIFIGQVYPSGAVYLDVTEDREEGKKRWPKSIAIYPLQSGTDAKSPMTATLIGPLERVYPPESETIGEKSPDCSAPKYHQDPSLSYETPPAGGIKDYYDRGALDNCSAYNVAKYFLSQKVTKSFPVFAVADYEVKEIDYAVQGQPRPLSMAERREVSQFHFADDDEDKQNSHFLEAATQMVTFEFPAVGLWARFSTFVNDRGEQRTRTVVLDVLERKRVRKRHLRTSFKGSL